MQREKAVVDLRRALAGHQPRLIEEDYTQAAVLVGVSCGPQEPALILTQRALHLNLHPGESAFPGGKCDPEDTSLLATALREAEEEVALPAAAFEYLGELDQRVTRSNIKVSPFVGLIEDGVALEANRDELECIYTVPLSFFADSRNLQVDKVEYRGSLRYVPRFEYLGQTVWGMTAMVIVDLMNTVFNAGLDLAEKGDVL